MEYTDDGVGGISCPQCAYEQGDGHASWCDNPERHDLELDDHAYWL